ncbi:MAG TPA: HIT domain-containing protein [Bryobacteraceae bacterium]|nr:HIT domain-containing protein [Bryobacteraceae bacterium]
MDHLWSPWRYRYVSTAEPSAACIFCAKSKENRDAENLILHRGSHNFVLLNLYPYTSGHLMVAPYEHVATLEDADEKTVTELMLLTRTAQTRLREVYRAPGFNVGMNIGSCAGAGIAGHIHMHVLPRWPGDVNFMTTVGETRVIPEDIHETYRKLLASFGHL